MNPVSKLGETVLEYDGDGPTARWAVMDDRAVPRGELELPANVRIVWSSGDTFWAVLPDEFDVPWVVRYPATRVTTGSRGERGGRGERPTKPNSRRLSSEPSALSARSLSYGLTSTLT